MTTQSQPVLNPIAAGACDIAEGLRNWRIWHLMGTSELRRRYARSRLGQFWLTLSTAITVVTLGAVWSLLWKMPIGVLLPYFAISFVVWTFMTAFFTEAATVIAGNGNYFINQKLAFSTVIFALAYRSLIMLAHNCVIVVAVLVVFAVPVTWTALLALPGLALTTIAGSAVGYMIAIACHRYRDLVQVVGNFIQIVFFITPVLWRADQLPADVAWIVDYNPLAVFLAIVRDPILGTPVPVERWEIATAMTAGAVMVALYTVGALRKRIIYWI